MFEIYDKVIEDLMQQVFDAPIFPCEIKKDEVLGLYKVQIFFIPGATDRYQDRMYNFMNISVIDLLIFRYTEISKRNVNKIAVEILNSVLSFLESVDGTLVGLKVIAIFDKRVDWYSSLRSFIRKIRKKERITSRRDIENELKALGVIPPKLALTNALIAENVNREKIISAILMMIYRETGVKSIRGLLREYRQRGYKGSNEVLRKVARRILRSHEKGA